MTTLERLRKKFPVLIAPRRKADARVAIAQDVIETLRIGRMVAAQDGYFNYQGSMNSFEAVTLGVRAPASATCRVCALGAALVCAVGLYDKAPELESYFRSNRWHRSTFLKVLYRWFRKSQLSLIECAFERNNAFMGANAWDRVKAMRFGEKYDDDHDRLVAIMQNIVDNGGTFKP